MKLLLLSDRIDFDEKTIAFDFSVIQSHLSLSLKTSNYADLKEFENTVEEFKPDIIHSHLFEAELLSRWKVFPEITYVTHCHNNMSQVIFFSGKKSLKKMFNPSLNISEDAELFVRILAKYDLFQINKYGCIYYLHDDNTTNLKNNSFKGQLKSLKIIFNNPELKKYISKKVKREKLSVCFLVFLNII